MICVARFARYDLVMKLRAFSLLCLLTMLVGCGSHSETYEVLVQNDTDKPLTIGFTKEGEPFQDEWMAPDQIAQDPQVNPDLYPWGILIPPGKNASTNKPMTAKLQEDAIAYVRVYRGKLNMTDMLAIGRESPSRIDVPLMPGKNSLAIIEKNGRLAVTKGP